MVKPFSPTDIAEKSKDTSTFPDEVIQVVNGLLMERGRASKYITILQDDVLSRLEQLCHQKGLPFDRQEVFNRHWLDFEDVYRAQGWHVEYDRPGIGDSYSAHWVFVSSSC